MKVSQIPLGESLVFGRYLVNEIIWDKVTELNGFLSHYALVHLMADAREPENTSGDRRERGSNFFPQTNICTLLNSEEKDWYKPQHDKDSVDGEVRKTYPGFLCEFDSWERRLIVPQEITTIVPRGFNREFGDHVKTTVKVSLPSRSQIYGGEDDTEGGRFEYYSQGGLLPANILLRTAIGTGLCAVGRTRQIVNQSPAKDAGIAPFILIDPNADVEFDAALGRYCILPPQSYVKEVTDELHQILK